MIGPSGTKWKGKTALYAVILDHFAARHTGDTPSADKFLTDSAGKFDNSWPYPVVQFLRGEIDETALLLVAADDDMRTEAHCYLGLDQDLKGHLQEALSHHRWVNQHGPADFLEYRISVAELERLGGQAEGLKR